MLKGRYKYKCRNCGDFFLNGPTENYNRMEANIINITLGRKTEEQYNPPQLLVYHNCSELKKVTGLGDLVAVVSVDK